MNEVQTGQAERLRQLHGEIVGAAWMVIEKAIEAGAILAEVKASLPHGGFTAWVEAEAGFSVRTAQRYMKIYDNRDMIKNDSVSLLTDAHRLLTESKQAATDIDMDAVRFEMNELKVKMDTLDENLPVDEKIGILVKIVERARMLCRIATERTITAQMEFGRILNDVRDNQDAWDDCNEFCKAWTGLFEIYDTNPVNFFSKLLSIGADQDVVRDIFQMREDIMTFPARYDEIRSLVHH